MTMTMNVNSISYPQRNWDPGLRYNLELIRFMQKVEDFAKIEIPDVPDANQTQKELRELHKKEKVREQFDRKGELIRARIIDQVDTIVDFHRLMMFTPGSHPATLRLMSSMQQLGTIGAMYFKDKFSRPRPTQLDTSLRPSIDVPPHPSYPSGHATQAHLVARALATVSRQPEFGEQLFKIADDVAINREYAGVHYESDSNAGRILAHKLFEIAEESMEETFQDAAQEW